MEFHEKLQKLRKEKGLTQEELATALYVSRTAVSKWESGRGLPGLDSLKAIAKFFSLSLDDLLSGEKLLALAEDENKKKAGSMRDTVRGLCDCGAAVFLFLPLYGQHTPEGVRAVPLPALAGFNPAIKLACFAIIGALALCGVVNLALQNCTAPFWLRLKRPLSLSLGMIAVLLFILCRQPYAAVCFLFFLFFKVIVDWKAG